MNLLEKEKQIADQLNMLEDWMFQYDFILMKTVHMPVLAREEQTEETLVHGCQSKVWIQVAGTEDCVRIRGESLSVIVKGLLAMLIEILDAQPAQSILNYEIRFLEETAVGRQLSVDRQMGMKAMLAHIKAGVHQIQNIQK